MPETQTKQSNFERTKELTDRLEAGMKDLFQSDKYKDFLKTMSHFHHYTRRNIMLINMQCPGATRVAGLKVWNEKFNRRVKKGEEGIRIFAPIKDTEPEKKLMEKLDPETGAPLLDNDGKVIMEEMTALTGGVRFKLVPVFDVSQTYGDPLPELIEDLTGNVDHYAAFMDALKDVSPLPIEFEKLNENQDGYCRYGEKIGIREGMSEVQTVSAVIHEIIHARLHDRSAAAGNAEPKSKVVKEVEAESCAYVTAQHFGIETSPNSFGYLAEYGSRDMKELNASLDTIRKEANSLINDIDSRFMAICKERGIDLSPKEPEKPAAPVKQAGPEYATEARTETVAGVDFTVSEVVPAAPKTIEQRNYEKLAELFPEITSNEYYYLRSEAGAGFMPLSLEWIDTDKLSVMHTYSQNGDLMYDPMIVLQVDQEAKTAAAVEFQQSSPPLYQQIDDGIGYSIDGNGNQRNMDAAKLQGQINSFTAQWLDNIGDQGYEPVRAVLRDAGRADPSVYFNDDKKRFSLLFQYDRDGTTVLNNLDRDDKGSMAMVARVDSYRNVKFFEENLPKDVVTIIENVKLTHEKERQLETKPARENEAAKAPPTPEYDDSMPDPAIGISEMNLYGYLYEFMLPLTKERALELFDNDEPVYLLYPDNSEAMALDRSEIETFDGIFGINQGEWERTVEYKLLSSKNSEAAKESGVINGDADMFGIYQLKDAEGLRYHRFASLNQLEADNLAVDRANYELAYTAPLPPKETLDELYQRFNADHPKDYTGRSLSVSDVVIIQRGGEVTSHYVDNLGFAELPAFLGNERKPEIAAMPGQADIADDKPLAQPVVERKLSEMMGLDLNKQPEQDNKTLPPLPDVKNQSVYMKSPDHARENNELDKYRESNRLNKECAGAIDAAIKECVVTSGRGYRLTPEAVSNVVGEYGEQRVSVVLANTIRLADWDGRYSKDTKDWANGVTMPEVRDNRAFFSSAHPAVLDGYIRLARKEMDDPEKKPSILAALKQGADKARQAEPPQKEPPNKKKGLEV
jgi:uncharacterized protein YqiB (DUF1249 family)